MKLLSVFTFVMLSFSAAFGQRFAYVDTEYILNKIPEYKSAQKQLDALVLEWEKEIEKKKQTISSLRKNFEAEKVFLTEDLQGQRLTDISAREKELTSYQISKFGVDGELFKKRQELIKPIQDRIFDAIQKVAKDNAVDVVFDKASAVTMLFANPKLDRSDEVLEEMGIAGSIEDRKKEEDDLPQEQPK